MVLGPLIDPPAPQHTYRPDGVYRSPDVRVGCEGRTLFEVWAGGECIAFASIMDRHAGGGTEAAFWSWFDERTDTRLTVNDRHTLPSARPRHLRSI